MLRRIFYVSLIAGHTTRVDIGSIVSGSIIWNRRNDVTGLLVACQSNFAQVLEGRAEAVETVMGRIRRDAHHHAVHVQIEEPITQRLFGGWSMAYLRREDLAEHLLSLHASSDAVLNNQVLHEMARASRELSSDL